MLYRLKENLIKEKNPFIKSQICYLWIKINWISSIILNTKPNLHKISFSKTKKLLKLVCLDMLMSVKVL